MKIECVYCHVEIEKNELEMCDECAEKGNQQVIDFLNDTVPELNGEDEDFEAGYEEYKAEEEFIHKLGCIGEIRIARGCSWQRAYEIFDSLEEQSIRIHLKGLETQ